MKIRSLLCVLSACAIFGSCGRPSSIKVAEGSDVDYKGHYTNFDMSALVKSSAGGQAGILFHTDDTGKGYEVLIGNGDIDGSRKTGSLSSVRNLYKSIAKDGEWFSIGISVRGKNISITVDSTEVVNYTEPAAPYRNEANSNMLLGSGSIRFKGYKGDVEFKDIAINALADDAVNENALEAVDEQADRVIRLQQENFPVIDYHVHLKGWGKEEAYQRSMSYGINYGIAPNCGIGFPITTDAQVAAYCDSTQNMPFMFGMQGEGREWPQTFSEESRKRFDYVFTDALTYTDHKNRRTRLWIDEEVFVDIPQEKYMDLIVDKIVKVLSEEPIDIYVNPCFLPSAMEKDYDALWTPDRIERVVKELKNRGIALEINARYRIPNFAFISAAKDAGVKFSFGTNNGDPNIGKLEYCIEAMDACGLTAENMWFPSMKANK